MINKAQYEHLKQAQEGGADLPYWELADMKDYINPEKRKCCICSKRTIFHCSTCCRFLCLKCEKDSKLHGTFKCGKDGYPFEPR